VNALVLRLRASELVTIFTPQILLARGNPPRARLHGLLFARGVLKKGNRHLSLNESFVEPTFTTPAMRGHLIAHSWLLPGRCRASERSLACDAARPISRFPRFSTSVA